MLRITVANYELIDDVNETETFSATQNVNVCYSLKVSFLKLKNISTS